MGFYSKVACLAIGDIEASNYHFKSSVAFASTMLLKVKERGKIAEKKRNLSNTCMSLMVKLPPYEGRLLVLNVV